MTLAKFPMSRAAEVAGLVVAATFLVKVCRAFSSNSRITTSRGSASSPASSRVPEELTKCESALLERLELATSVALEAGAAMKRVINLKTKNVMHKGATDLVTETDKGNEKLIFDAIRSRFPDDKLIGEESSAESGTLPPLTDDPTWIVDPVDGTTNFVHGLPMTCVSVGFSTGGKMAVGVVYDPCSDELFQVVRGFGAFVNGKRSSTSGSSEMGSALVITEYGYQHDPDKVKIMMDATQKVVVKSRALRQIGSGCLDLCWVGCGRADGLYAGVAGEGWHPWDYAAGWLFAEESGGVVTQIDGSPFHLYSESVLCAASKTLAQELSSTLAR